MGTGFWTKEGSTTGGSPKKKFSARATGGRKFFFRAGFTTLQGYILPQKMATTGGSKKFFPRGLPPRGPTPPGFFASGVRPKNFFAWGSYPPLPTPVPIYDYEEGFLQKMLLILMKNVSSESKIGEFTVHSLEITEIHCHTFLSKIS